MFTYFSWNYRVVGAFALVLILGLIALSGCALLPSSDDNADLVPTIVPATEVADTELSSAPTPTDSAAETVELTAVPSEAEEASSSLGSQPKSDEPENTLPVAEQITYPPLAQAPVTAAQLETSAALETNLPPERNEVELAIAYKGVDPADISELAPVVDLTVGTVQELILLNIDSNTNQPVQAELKAISDYAYFWFDQTVGNAEPTQEQLDAMGAAFDLIYQDVQFYFGVERQPGIDGDLRVHIVNASPATICNSAGSCGLLGYFSSRDGLPRVVQAQSNERDMFVMNGSRFGTDLYLEVLAHEFRHMIEDNYDRNDIDWEVEGSAMLAEDLLGYPTDPINRANFFLASPDQQLNRWSDGNTTPRYGQGYLLNRYIYDRFGTDLYREFAQSPLPGLLAVTQIAADNGLDFDGIQLWRDWLVAAAIHQHRNAPQKYEMPNGIAIASMTDVSDLPFVIESTVNQYAADYYRLNGNGTVNIDFRASTHTQLIDELPVSGTHMWVANRTNFSQMQLTRAFDLTAVSSATLQYDVYRDIEQGYDFAYASVSTDGGQSWVSLQAENMDGLRFEDNPGDGAFQDRFYSGRGSQWIEESVDLSAYAGQEIEIRFEYVTDPILTFNGLALDDIAIPEINFFDGAENDMGWTASGFVRATGYLPQEWHIQLVEFQDGVPTVRLLELDELNGTQIKLDLADSGGEQPILIVAASAPMTLNAAHYRLTID